ncbi:MAG: hypothetical protein NTV06_01820, partial [candidate division Zixibacteria bacterium]|nr:hypothetical protein [candidate division Zixibacteria bacterium]
PTKELNDFLEDTVKKQPPAAARGKYIKMFYATQTGTKPPTFLFFCNYPALLQRNYLRYMEGQFRDVFDFEGTPIRMKFRKR